MKTFVVAVMSANGKISRDSSKTIDWNSTEDLKWFKFITTQIGVVIMGRKTFELIGRPLPKRLNVVMTRNYSSFRNEPNLIFTSEEPINILKTLEKKGYSQTAVIGGKEIFTLFLKEKLIDEMYITYEPVIIDGIDMFSDLKEDVRMRIEGIKSLSNAVVVHYKVLETKEER